jgi:DNA invertase Pin-like site-specific DNA recombinase
MADGLNVAKYLRISKDDGRFGESQSIGNQRKIIDDYIAARPDLSSGAVFEFIDDGISGVSLGRPAVERMLDMVKRGEIGCVIVKDFSRFSRDYIDAGDYLEQIFPFLGTRFISVNDHYDSAIHGSLAGDVGNSFKNLYNSYFSKDLSRKVRSGLRSRKESGNYTPSHCPYGYKKPERKCGSEKRGFGMVIDDEAAAVVRRIFQMKAEGSSAVEIARTLNAERIPTPSTHLTSNGGTMGLYAKSDKPLWAKERIHRILKDIRYTGIFAYDMYKSAGLGDKASNRCPMESWKLVHEAIPPIVTEETFEAAQNKGAGGRGDRQVGGKGKQPLSGKLLCGGCGYALERDKRKDVCHCARKEFTGDADCLGENANLTHIIAAVGETVKKLFERNEIQSAGVLRLTDGGALEATKEIAEAQKEVKAFEKQKTALYERYCDGEIDRDEYVRLHTAEESAYRRALTNLESLESRYAEGLSRSAGSVQDRLDGLVYDGTLTREIEDALIESVRVYEGGRLEIRWTFDDPLPQEWMGDRLSVLGKLTAKQPN